MKRIFCATPRGYASREFILVMLRWRMEAPISVTGRRKKAATCFGSRKTTPFGALLPIFSTPTNPSGCEFATKFGDEGPHLEFTRGTPRDSLMQRFRGLEVVTVAGIDYAEDPINFAGCYTGALCESIAPSRWERETKIRSLQLCSSRCKLPLTRKSSSLYSDTFIRIF